MKKEKTLTQQCDDEFNVSVVLASIFIFIYIFISRDVILIGMTIACAVFSVGVRKQKKEIIRDDYFYGSI